MGIAVEGVERGLSSLSGDSDALPDCRRERGPSEGGMTEGGGADEGGGRAVNVAVRLARCDPAPSHLSFPLFMQMIIVPRRRVGRVRGGKIYE